LKEINLKIEDKTETQLKQSEESKTKLEAEKPTGDDEIILMKKFLVLEKTSKKGTTPYSDFSLPESSIKLLKSKVT